MSNYDILGLPSNAKKEDIKKAYRKLSLRYHPDRPGGNNDKYLVIRNAYDSLMKPDTTRIHHQYEHKMQPAVTILSNNFYPYMHKVVVHVMFHNIINAMTVSSGDLRSSWNLYSMNIGTLELDKKFLQSCGYKFQIVFTGIDDTIFVHKFEYNDPRTRWQKLVYKLKSLI
jgi:curved DNA-binding protein CbpA